MAEVAVLNQSHLDDKDVAFAVRAADIQMGRDVMKYWVGLDYCPIRFYGSLNALPTASGVTRLMVLKDTLDTPNALGYHSDDVWPYSAVVAHPGFASTISHEHIEMAVDPTAAAWVIMGNVRVAMEACDPCEAGKYPIEVDILGEKRDVMVSNFVFPSWFDMTMSQKQVDFLGQCPGPGQLAPGGYEIVLDADGHVRDVWAQTDTPAESMARRMRKVLNSTSRSYRRGVRV